MNTSTPQELPFALQRLRAETDRVLARGNVYAGTFDPPQKVLVIDQNLMSRVAVTRELAHAGFDVVDATAAQALESVKFVQPDLMVLDVRPPDATGVDVCKAVKSDPATSPSVLCFSDRPGDRITCLEAGADAFVPTSSGLAELVARARMLLRARGSQATTAAGSHRAQVSGSCGR